MNKEVINTTDAPAAIGPYSQGIKLGDLIFTSGQLPVDPKTGEIPQGIERQAKQSFENVGAVLKASGSCFHKVVKVNVFLQDLADFAKVNELYADYFSEPFPARSCFQVAALPKGALIEVEAIASI